MNTSSNRIIVTEKGKKLQDQLKDPLFEFSIPSSTRSVTNASGKFLDPLDSTNYGMRTGYFRPKFPQTISSKISDSNNIYPNYLKRDPREYPSKHQCSWHEKLTVEGSHETPLLFPINKTLHHTLYNPESLQKDKPSTIREVNTLVEGKYGYIPLNLTTCQYPQYQSSPNIKKIEKLRDSIQLVSPHGDSYYGGHGKVTNSSRMGFETDRGSHFQNRYNSTARVQTEASFDATNSSFRKVNMKKSQDKSEQLIRKFVQQQIDYGELLHKVDKKVKENHDIQQENPDYVAGIFEKIHKSDLILQQLTAVNDSEVARAKLRLKDVQDKKYGVFWKKQKIFKKTKSVKTESSESESNKTLPQVERNIQPIRRISQGRFELKLPQEQPKLEKKATHLSQTPSNRTAFSKEDGARLLELIKFESHLSASSYKA